MCAVSPCSLPSSTAGGCEGSGDGWGGFGAGRIRPSAGLCWLWLVLQEKLGKS